MVTPELMVGHWPEQARSGNLGASGRSVHTVMQTDTQHTQMQALEERMDTQYTHPGLALRHGVWPMELGTCTNMESHMQWEEGQRDGIGHFDSVILPIIWPNLCQNTKIYF